jgi:hypothetical protein
MVSLIFLIIVSLEYISHFQTLGVEWLCLLKRRCWNIHLVYGAVLIRIRKWFWWRDRGHRTTQQLPICEEIILARWCCRGWGCQLQLWNSLRTSSRKCILWLFGFPRCQINTTSRFAKTLFWEWLLSVTRLHRQLGNSISPSPRDRLLVYRYRLIFWQLNRCYCLIV